MTLLGWMKAWLSSLDSRGSLYFAYALRGSASSHFENDLSHHFFTIKCSRVFMWEQDGGI